MSNCCVQSVPPDSSYETFDQPVLDWVARLTAGLNRSIPNQNQTMGDLAREILQRTQGLERKLLEEASQKKADQSPPIMRWDWRRRAAPRLRCRRWRR